jgi:ankyrin repeat protein
MPSLLLHSKQVKLSLHDKVSALTKKLEEAYTEICESLKSPSFPLHKAAQEGKTVAVKALIYCGANKEERCVGNTPLHWAAQSGLTATVEALIHLGADKEATVIGMKHPCTFLQQSHSLIHFR